jgi:TolB protein
VLVALISGPASLSAECVGTGSAPTCDAFKNAELVLLAQNPAWSPDGGRIAFASTRDGDSATTGSDIYVIRADGTNIRRLTRDQKPVGHPRWSPDGRQLVFRSTGDRVAGTAAEVELYVVGADGTDMRRITENQLYDGQADW